VIDDPEESTQYEFGYRYISESGRIQNTVALYQLTKKNMTIPLTGPLQGDKQIQVGSQRSRGLEIELVTHWLRDWYTFLNYTYTEADLLTYYSLTVDKYVKTTLEDFSGNRPAFVPAQIINFWTVKEFLNGLGIGLGVYYISNQFIHVDNDYEIEEHFTLNASVFYNFHRGGWSLNFRNITDSQYYFHGFGPYSIIPADLFSIQVTVHFVL
jgi:iron complex outermembrane receptor protein